jgi:hypothetical protein
MQREKILFVVLGMYLSSLLPGLAAQVNKTMRIEHGRPIVVVSQGAVLLLEFVRQPNEALVPNASSDVRHCRERYRCRLFDSVTGQVAESEGVVEEIRRVVSRGTTGILTEDIGSRTSIGVGEFSLSWSEATAGFRSWIYYRANSGIRFIQQPQHIELAAVDTPMFRRYLAAKNIQDYVDAGRTIQVIGPAVFHGDAPDETAVSAFIQSCAIRAGAVEFKLSGLELKKPYVIESSYDLRNGNWNAVHTFIAHQPDSTWSDPIGADVNLVFYRIRQGS